MFIYVKNDLLNNDSVTEHVNNYSGLAVSKVPLMLMKQYLITAQCVAAVHNVHTNIVFICCMFVGPCKCPHHTSKSMWNHRS